MRTTQIYWKAQSLKREAIWHTRSGGKPLFGMRGTRILTYHGVCEKDPFRFNTLFVTQSMLESQLLLFKSFCRIIPLEEAFSQEEGDGLRLCLSFDDGFANNLHLVLPLLEKHRIPATFFVTTLPAEGPAMLWNDVLCLAARYGPGQFTWEGDTYFKRRDGKYMSATEGRTLNEILRTRSREEKQDLLKFLKPRLTFLQKDEVYWRLMGREDIHQMAQSPWVTVGSHGHYHNDLAFLPAPEAERELSLSKSILEEWTGRPVKALAFPYGSYTEETLKLAKKSGYTRLLGTETPLSDLAGEPLLRARLTINPFISPIHQLYAACTGHYH